IARMNIWVFSLFTFLGALVWNSVLGGLGYWLSLHVSPDQLFEKVEEYNKYLTWCGYGIAVICVLFILWNAFKPKKKMNEV
ncbi:MAG: DedA family protein, partial [Muribaculaceae bacterium]|nr:DedA family protein [Muribaculaceae bacterium]